MSSIMYHYSRTTKNKLLSIKILILLISETLNLQTNKFND